MSIAQISFEEGKKLLDTVPGAMLLDVRTEEEYEAERAEGALLLPLGDIAPETAAEVIPDYNTTVLLYCRTGNRSSLAAKRLARYGYKNLYDLGGLNGWPYGMDFG